MVFGKEFHEKWGSTVGEVVWDLEAHGIQPGRMFGLKEIDDIQQVMYPEYQVVVASAGYDNAVISRSPPIKTPGMPEIVVHYDKEHFDLITNLEGFLMTGYYCQHCESRRFKTVYRLWQKN